jgi:hypothetical protein
MLLLNDYFIFFIIKFKLILLLKNAVEYNTQNINQLVTFHLLIVDYLFIHNTVLEHPTITNNMPKKQIKLGV